MHPARPGADVTHVRALPSHPTKRSVVAILVFAGLLATVGMSGIASADAVVVLASPTSSPAPTSLSLEPVPLPTATTPGSLDDALDDLSGSAPSPSLLTDETVSSLIDGATEEPEAGGGGSGSGGSGSGGSGSGDPGAGGPSVAGSSPGAAGDTNGATSDQGDEAATGSGSATDGSSASTTSDTSPLRAPYATTAARAAIAAGARALRAAGPFAAPLVLALAALGSLIALARGSDRLVKVDSTLTRHTYRL